MPKERKAVEVAIVTERSIDNLEKATNKYIVAGWEPQGGMVELHHPSGPKDYAMTMVAYETLVRPEIKSRYDLVGML